MRKATTSPEAAKITRVLVLQDPGDQVVPDPEALPQVLQPELAHQVYHPAWLVNPRQEVLDATAKLTTNAQLDPRDLRVFQAAMDQKAKPVSTVFPAKTLRMLLPKAKILEAASTAPLDPKVPLVQLDAQDLVVTQEAKDKLVCQDVTDNQDTQENPDPQAHQDLSDSQATKERKDVTPSTPLADQDQRDNVVHRVKPDLLVMQEKMLQQAKLAAQDQLEDQDPKDHPDPLDLPETKDQLVDQEKMLNTAHAQLATEKELAVQEVLAVMAQAVPVVMVDKEALLLTEDTNSQVLTEIIQFLWTMNFMLQKIKFSA